MENRIEVVENQEKETVLVEVKGFVTEMEDMRDDLIAGLVNWHDLFD